MRFFLSVLLILAALSASAQIPGMVKVGENLYMDESEIVNVHWLEYLFLLRQDSSKEAFLAALPDTSVWEGSGYFPNWHYLRYPGYRFYPVVGVSYEQAKAYCKWRADVINSDLQAKDPDISYRFVIRLPTAEEWERIARSHKGVVQREKKKKVKKNFGRKIKRKQPDIPFSAEEIQAQEEAFFARGALKATINCKPFLESPPYREHLKPKKYTPVTKPLRSWFAGPPNQLGMYNMLGNVAEWVEEGYAKGGSWQHEMEECLPHQKQEVKKPTNWLGFRCVGEIHPRTGEQGEENP